MSPDLLSGGEAMRSTLALLILALTMGAANASDSIPSEWKAESPRDELRPNFDWDESGGPEGTGELIIRADDRKGLMGAWTRIMRVEGDRTYRFDVARKTEGMKLERRGAIARILWLDRNGQKVLRPDPTFSSYRPGERPRAEPEFPEVVRSEGRWVWLRGQYRVPPTATHAKIELHFRWGPPRSSVGWSLPEFAPLSGPLSRKVRLATVHYQPRSGHSRQEKCEQFAPFIQQAAQRNADLVVLPETLTYYGTKGSYADAAEPIPGPSTDYFGSLAKQHDLYIVAGLIEREQHLIYNVAVLLGPDGQIVGKYRKVTLPRGEIEGGIMPGDEYPVFETRFGKVGMMICYDGFFPEVARELSNRGAEVIAWPVWGCNPMLASARACENHVYVVSSTYTNRANNWMISAIFGHDGEAIAQAEDFGEVAIAEVDLAQPLYWHSLGDFRAQIQAHRPSVVPVP